MRTVPLISLLILAALFAGLSVCEPSFLARNTFLYHFVNHEYVNVMAVLVTVSLVSVTQIHLEYSRIERRFKTRVFEEARRTINIGAILLTSMLLLAFLISFFRAAVHSNDTLLSIAHGIALLTIIATVLIMYDFVRVVYVLAAEEPLEEQSECEKEVDPDSKPKK